MRHGLLDGFGRGKMLVGEHRKLWSRIRAGPELLAGPPAPGRMLLGQPFPGRSPLEALAALFAGEAARVASHLVQLLGHFHALIMDPSVAQEWRGPLLDFSGGLAFPSPALPGVKGGTNSQPCCTVANPNGGYSLLKNCTPGTWALANFPLLTPSFPHTVAVA